MTNDILCPIDFSDSSKVAMKWSINLAKMLNAHLSILYTYRLIKQDGEVIDLKRKIEEEASKNFGVLEKELLAGTGITYNFKTEVGFVDDRIEDHARKNKISFLVMGKGMSLRNKETFDDLVEHLQVPLVIVP
jgi:nucleotide-binding universal stress UspA family protein